MAIPSVLLAVATACGTSDSDENVGQGDYGWDSQDGNPTHATHSLMAEFAIRNLAPKSPELTTYKDALLAGANLELHELPTKKWNDLRLEVGGNNWAADKPQILWDRARASYAAGDKPGAYFYVGILLHYVQDMGVPAHAFHVIHQSSFGKQDNIEILGFFDFHADFSSEVTPDPHFANPTDYVEWSGKTARDHFQSVFGNVTYTRTFFPQAYDDLTDTHWAFLRRREAECARFTEYALASAVAAFAK